MPFLKFIDFKMTTNSFIYSLVEQFFEPHFHKNNYRGKGYTFGKNLTKFSGLYTPYLGCGGILYEQQVTISNTPDIKNINKDDKAEEKAKQKSNRMIGIKSLNIS